MGNAATTGGSPAGEGKRGMTERRRFWSDNLLVVVGVALVLAIGSVADAATREARCYRVLYQMFNTFLERDISPGDRLGMGVWSLTDEQLDQLDAPHDRRMQRLKRRFERRLGIAGCWNSSNEETMRALNDARGSTGR